MLYSCRQTTIDETGLKSYTRGLVSVHKDSKTIDMLIERYPERTATIHLHKAIKWYREHDMELLGDLLEQGLEWGVRHGIRDIHVCYWRGSGDISYERI